MNYRNLGKTGLKVSEVGFGCEYINNTPYENVKNSIHTALDNGINILDVFMPDPQIRSDIGKALGSHRKDVILQGHIGAVFKNGQYSRSRDIKECETAVNDFLTRFNTDYIDLGMMHYIDTEEDYDAVFGHDSISYVQKLKRDGKIRFIGFSSHSAETAMKIVNTGIADMFLFSINPAFDMLPSTIGIYQMFEDKSYESSRFEIDPDRARLYNLCEEKGIGITVMKALGAGNLLNEKTSPFGSALTPVQCIHYALERPAVASVLVGAKNPAELLGCLEYETSTEEQKDYTLIAKNGHFSMSGKCMYCNHCLPCISNIDIAQVTKCLDMAKISGITDSVKEHYDTLSAHGSDCISCGSCESNCPFRVAVIKNMNEAAAIFGK